MDLSLIFFLYFFLLPLPLLLQITVCFPVLRFLLIIDFVFLINVTALHVKLIVAFTSIASTLFLLVLFIVLFKFRRRFFIRAVAPPTRMHNNRVYVPPAVENPSTLRSIQIYKPGIFKSKCLTSKANRRDSGSLFVENVLDENETMKML